MNDGPRHLVALEQCGLELQAPHLRTTTKRRIETSDVDAAALPDDSLRFVGWAPEAIEARFPGLDPSAAYELEATYLCERHVRRVVAMTSRGRELHPPTELAPGTVTTVRVAVPPAAYADGTLDVAVARVEGPDVVLSELRLFSSRPPAPAITVVGDSRGGLIGTVGAPDWSGVAGARVRVTGDAGTIDVSTDASGLFRVPLHEGLPLGRHGRVTIATGDGPTAAEVVVDTRHVSRGLRELPPASERLDLGGAWSFRGGPFAGHEGHADGPTTRVPGHVIYDGLVPEDGVATFQRTVEVPATWTGRAVFLRCDGAYGRAEVVVNGTLAGVHGSGATSFDVELTPFLRPGVNDLAITLTEYTPYAVLDDMSWYAHMSLLGIWRDVFLFSVPPLHLGQLDLATDWDPGGGTGSLELGVDAINLGPEARPFELEATIRDAAGAVAWRGTASGSVDGAGSTDERLETGPLAVHPWSAEEPVLYDLEVVLAGDAGEPQAYRRRIGFRRVEVRGNQLLVNGAPIRVRGINRHDSRILKGRALSADDMRDDVVNLRRANVNVIRTSHYPPSPHLLDICDEVGMFVLEQPPICFSGGFDDHHWTRTNEAAQLVPYLLEVTAETVARDQGHASVIVWDLGNESRWGSGFDAQLALVREMDPTRPTIFSFDLNELGPENRLVGRPAAERPDLRSYHYPGWDRTWQEDLAWLGAYDEPTILDEYAPVFAPCLRGPGEGFGLAIDPGIRDAWGAGYQPFMEAALGEHGVIGGLIWGGFGEVFAIPLDLTVGEGPWAHLPAADYIRTRDHYPAEPGVFRRGDGDWGSSTPGTGRGRRSGTSTGCTRRSASARTRPPDGERLVVTLENRFAHRSLEGLKVRVSGGRVEEGGEAELTARPGETERLVLRRDPGAEAVRLEVWHPEGWLVDGGEWPWPGPPAPRDAVLERAAPVQLDLRSRAARVVAPRVARGWAAGRELHVLDVDMPHVPVPLPRTDGGHVVALGPDAVRARWRAGTGRGRSPRGSRTQPSCSSTRAPISADAPSTPRRSA